MSPGQWVACGVTGVVIAGSLTAYAGYHDALSIDTEEINTDAWGDRPSQVEGIHNFLLLGVDTESGGQRPDVLVIVNVDVGEGAVTMVNLPRDMIVDIPVCDPVEDFPGWPGGQDQINHSASYGGFDCLGNTVEALTHIHLDHLVMVDFAGFEDIVNTVGGIEMCIPKAIDDPKAHLTLEAGQQELNGEQALGLARSRASTEHGSDLGRIESQQRVIGALMREVTSGTFLSNPASVYSFLDSVTDSLVVDDGLTMDTMAELVIALREVDLSRMNMVMVPVVESQTHGGKVDPQVPQAGELFAAVAAGEVLPDDGEEDGDDGEGGDASDKEVEPPDVSLRLVNATGTDGLAAQVRPLLEGEGFTVTEIGNPGLRVPEATTVYHGPGQEARAQALAAALQSAQVEEAADLGGDLELVMGATDWGLAGGGGDEDGGGSPLAELDSTSAADVSASCE